MCTRKKVIAICILRLTISAIKIQICSRYQWIFLRSYYMLFRFMIGVCGSNWKRYTHLTSPLLILISFANFHLIKLKCYANCVRALYAWLIRSLWFVCLLLKMRRDVCPPLSFSANLHVNNMTWTLNNISLNWLLSCFLNCLEFVRAPHTFFQSIYVISKIICTPWTACRLLENVRRAETFQPMW